MDIPHYLATEVKDGNAVLLLGAGASMEAKDDRGKRPPSAAELAVMISDRFLGGEFNDYPLNQVAEFAINESDLVTVQNFIRDLLSPFSPTRTHTLLTTFRWRGLATTNYDVIIEQAYEQNSSAVQRLVPFIKNGDRVDELAHGANTLQYLKLHGSVTKTDDPTCPLILTTDQYLQHRESRSLLFDRFKAWASDRPVIFIGYRLQDTDLRAVLLELERDIVSRPRYYIVCPSFSSTEARFWEQKKMTCIEAKTGEFLEELDRVVPSTFRGLRKTTPVGGLAITERFVTKDAEITEATREFVEEDVEYVKGATPTEVIACEKFYRGFQGGFAAICQNLDVRRKALTDALLLEHFVVDETEVDLLQFILVKAEAGAGKSVFLRRLAWEASHDHDCLCLFLRYGGRLNSAAIRELADLCQERLFVFIEDATLAGRDLEVFLSSVSAAGLKVTVVSAARTNEWNSAPPALTRFLTEDYELRYLSESEIDELLVLLERNNCLFSLSNMGKEERKAKLMKQAGRQLLVALHEATFGKPFEEIIRDEYDRISPELAQQIYRSICVLYRFNAPVRAGIIARLYGIGFEEFRENFFAPLEQVVTARPDKTGGDYSYVARHPHIAEIVFDVVLNDTDQRFEEYLKCLKYLDIDYTSDRRAFSQMTRGRELLKLFPDHQMVEQIFKLAEERSPNDPHLFHQMAIYEMNRVDGDLPLADSRLEQAARNAKGKTSDLVEHTRAELALRRAKQSEQPLARKKFLRQAVEICGRLKRRLLGSHAYHTVTKVGIFRIETALKLDDVTDEELERILRDTEQEISEGLKANPGDDYLLSAVAELATMLAQTSRAIKALEGALKENPRNAYVASTLARLYETQGEIEKACDVLRKALEANSNDKRLHHAYGKLRLQQGDATDEELLYHFRKAYTKGDENLDAQLLHARQVFIVEGKDASNGIFASLSKATVSADYQRRLLYPLEGQFYGRIRKLEATHCFIERDGRGEWIYCHASNVEDSVWRLLRMSERVMFSVAFTLRGPSAFDVILTSH